MMLKNIVVKKLLQKNFNLYKRRKDFCYKSDWEERLVGL